MRKDTSTAGPKPSETTGDVSLSPKADRVRVAASARAMPKTEASVRDARLKAALKANMARRKGQARARTGADAGVAGNDKNE